MAADDIDVSSIQTFTDAQLLAIYRNAYAHVAFGKSVTIAGRIWIAADEEFLRKQIDWLEARINVSGDTTGGIARITLTDE